MDKTLIDYDKNLKDLERQREKLEIVMQMMGQEWEESGAGIGWLGQLDLQDTNARTRMPATMIASDTSMNTAVVAMETNTAASDVTARPSLFSNILSQTTGPSPDYLQSLLHVNEALLAQSLANNNNNTSLTMYQPSTPMLTPVEEHGEILLGIKLNPPTMITPQQDDDANTRLDEDVNNTPRDYLGAITPESEMNKQKIISNIQLK